MKSGKAVGPDDIPLEVWKCLGEAAVGFYRDSQRELHCVFVDLEKAYDRVPREELWYCMRKSGVAEKYVRVVQNMYERSRTVVRCAVGQTEEFKVEVGLHQGSALSPFLFAKVMDQLSEELVEQRHCSNASRSTSGKLRQRGCRMVLPSIHLVNLRTLLNKIDKLVLLSRINKDFSNSAALCFTESWLNDAILDNTLNLSGFQLFRADQVAEPAGKSRGSGTCFYINERWCTDVTVLKKMCCPNLEVIFINCKPFYSLREFSSFILVSVYIPPQAHMSSALQLADQKPKITGLNDYRPVALTSVVMKSFERLVLAYLKNIIGPLLDPLQFAYRANRSMDDAVNMGLHFILQHLDKSGTYLLKFADNTTVIGLIQDGDESAYRQEVEQLAAWCSLNHLELNTLKTVEMIVDFRRNTPALPPLNQQWSHSGYPSDIIYMSFNQKTKVNDHNKGLSWYSQGKRQRDRQINVHVFSLSWQIFIADRYGSAELYSTARSILKRSINEANAAYKQKIDDHFSNGDP
ncbi:hypothetical protein QTP70_010182 [Hemibagrus guttatus]|uniref:Reverse transcriptase domain-containing protein n=1 Tax=Hemibagrus guttatus TaxID=175788 RepID=A0AAE0R9J0_9TELE|nr:hypothetical protein QTP70_010182 [Hemibagrus guttatus]